MEVHTNMGLTTKQSCICKGNLRAIVNETEHLFGKTYKDQHGDKHTFFGVVISEDDYYYGMHRHKDKQLSLLSCVGNIEGFGYTLEVE